MSDAMTIAQAVALYRAEKAKRDIPSAVMVEARTLYEATLTNRPAKKGGRPRKYTEKTT